jgi:hypothetical protein
MKKINVLKIVVAFFAISTTYAQKKLNLTLKYDTDFDRYEVFVKPNFSQKNFTWGPSQISLVLPSEILVEKIQIRNVDGGAWEDNSIVIAPAVMPNKSFHGVSSGGDKTDLVEDYESVLFYFTLPKKINPNDVRIYDNDTDPKSDSKGMMGGDFRNTIVDKTGNDWFSNIYKQEKVVVEIVEDKTPFEVNLFPNVITDNKFQVSLKGISEKDGDILMIVADASGNEVMRRKGSKSSLEKQTFNLQKNAAIEGLFVKFITPKGAISKRIITEN